MSNHFKYFKDKKEIRADWEKPVMHKHIETWNNRPHFTVSPEPDWEDGKIVYEDEDFKFESEQDLTGGDWEEKLIAIPLPKETEQQDIPMEKDDIINALADLIFTATKLWEDSNKRDGWDTEAVTITHPTIERAKEVLSKFQSPKEEKES